MNDTNPDQAILAQNQLESSNNFPNKHNHTGARDAISHNSLGFRDHQLNRSSGKAWI